MRLKGCYTKLKAYNYNLGGAYKVILNHGIERSLPCSFATSLARASSCISWRAAQIVPQVAPGLFSYHHSIVSEKHLSAPPCCKQLYRILFRVAPGTFSITPSLCHLERGNFESSLISAFSESISPAMHRENHLTGIISKNKQYGNYITSNSFGNVSPCYFLGQCIGCTLRQKHLVHSSEQLRHTHANSQRMGKFFHCSS